MTKKWSDEEKVHFIFFKTLSDRGYTRNDFAHGKMSHKEIEEFLNHVRGYVKGLDASEDVDRYIYRMYYRLARSQSAQSRDERSVGHPPAIAQKLAYLCLDRHDCEALLGDLDEQFNLDVAPRCGIAFARRWYAIEVFKSVRPLLIARAAKTLRIGIFVKLAEWIFRG